MAITYTIDSKGQANGVSSAITSNTLTCATGDFITIMGIYADNAESTAWTVSNTGTAITWTLQSQTNTGSNCKVVLWTGTAGATPPTTVTVTSTAGSLTNGSKYITTICHTGAHATTPLPAGNIFTGTSTNNVSRSITPTSSGSALWMPCADWNQTNTFAAGANCTIQGTYNETGFMTCTIVRPTTQPRTDAAAFTLSETDTGATIAYIAFEIQAAAGATTHDATGALTGPGSTITGSSSLTSNGAKIPFATTRKRKKKPAYDELTGFYNTNPFAEFSAELSPLWYNAGGPATHTTTGALVGQGSVITGSATRFRSFSTSGTLIGQGSIITGISVHLALHTTTGALLGQGSVIAGAAARFRSHDTSGALIGQGSEIVGAASRSAGAVTHDTSGALTGQGSTIVGVSARFRQFDTSGALLGQGSELSGTAARLRSFSTSGALVGQGSVIAGTAAHIAVHGATGSLIGQGSELTGIAARFRSHATSGALIGQGSVIDGAAIRIPPGGITHDTSGVLVGSGSDLSGLATNGQVIVSGGGVSFHRKSYSPKDIRESVEKQRNPRPKLTLKKPKEQEKQPDEQHAEQEQKNAVIRYKNSRSIDRYEQHYEQMLMAYLERVEAQLEEDAIIRIIAELL